MKKLLVATKNPGKLKEFERALKDLPIQLVSLSDLKISQDVEEDGSTYEENSQKKALFFAKISGLPTMGDDSGLEIDALNGEPGMKSRRWLGHEATDEELISHMKRVLKTIPKDKRGAQYRAVITLALPTGKMWSEEGTIRGVLSRRSKTPASKGFPYDSFFYIPKIKKYYLKGLLSEEEHKQYNHRYRALQKLIPAVTKELVL